MKVMVRVGVLMVVGVIFALTVMFGVAPVQKELSKEAAPLQQSTSTSSSTPVSEEPRSESSPSDADASSTAAPPSSRSVKLSVLPDGTKVLDLLIKENTAPGEIKTVKGYNVEAVDNRATSGSKKLVRAVLKKIVFLLPQVKMELPENHKKVFLDLGARMYPKGSTNWFQLVYPNSDEFEAHAFELLDLQAGYAPAAKYFKKFTYHQKAAWTHDNGVMIKGMRMAKVSDGVDSIKGDKRQEWRAPSVDVANFLMTNYKKDDFIVMKLDIEGGEWTLLPHLIKTGAIEWVDEMFFECHPLDYEDYRTFKKIIPPICLDLTNALRARGVAAHRWI